MLYFSLVFFLHQPVSVVKKRPTETHGQALSGHGWCATHRALGQAPEPSDHDEADSDDGWDTESLRELRRQAAYRAVSIILDHPVRCAPTEDDGVCFVVFLCVTITVGVSFSATQETTKGYT